jgi:hypothetical protein
MAVSTSALVSFVDEGILSPLKSLNPSTRLCQPGQAFDTTGSSNLIKQRNSEGWE